MTTQQQSASTEFGPNQWLVDELYQQYLADPESVDPAWHGFFEDYRPSEGSGGPSAIPPPPDDVTAVHIEPAPAPTTPVTPPSVAEPATPGAPTKVSEAVDTTVLRGPAARVVTNMEASLAVPTATSVGRFPPSCSSTTAP